MVAHRIAANQKTKVSKKIKLYIGQLFPKWQPRSSFQRRMFLELTNIRRRWESIWRPIDLKFLPDVTDGWRFPVWIIMVSFPQVPTDDFIKYIKKHHKTPKKSGNGGFIDTCAASLVGGTTEGQLLVLLHCPKVEVNGRCYDNRNILSSLVSGGKEKKSYFENVHYYTNLEYDMH